MGRMKNWLFTQINRLGERREAPAPQPLQFTADVVNSAQKLRIERDPLYPGYWHVIEPNDTVWLEYRVQTDEWIENGSIEWAVCNCPEGKDSASQVSRCPHVAAVLLAMVEELNR